jgi:hypothetical protein
MKKIQSVLVCCLVSLAAFAAPGPILPTGNLVENCEAMRPAPDHFVTVEIRQINGLEER